MAVKAKVKLKLSGRHAEDYLANMPELGTRPQVKIEMPKRKALPSRRGNAS